MQDKLKPPPTPWKHIIDGYQQEWLTDALGVKIPLNVSVVNHVVKCVNSHQALVDALEAVEELWGGDNGFNEEREACDSLEWDSPVYAVWKKIRAALLLAGGESETKGS